MLIEEVLNDSNSVKSDETKEKIEKVYSQDTNNENCTKVEDPENIVYENDNCDNEMSSKIVLPEELEELVNEALAELKSVQVES